MDYKRWYVCPYCGKKLVMFKKGAKSEKIFIRCRNCKEEVEIKMP